VQVVKLSENHTKLVEEFSKECAQAGYYNNSSLELMKWGKAYDLPATPDYWGLIVNNKLASISGCHSFVPFNPDFPQLRVLFRSATLPNFNNLIPGLSKNHMNSVPFSLLLPYQIAFGLDNNYRYFFITTSCTDHDASGKMLRTHKAISIISKNKLVTWESKEVVYNIMQDKWRINLPNYLTALKNFEVNRNKLGLSENYLECIATIEKHL